MKKVEIKKVVNKVEWSICNIEECKALSDETPCFNCTLFKDGKRFAQVSNEGRGGCDNYSYYDIKDRMGFEEEMNLSEIVYELLDLADTLRSLKRKEANHIILAKDGKYYTLPFVTSKNKKVSIKEMLRSESGKSLLKSSIERHEADGYEILNTNIHF